MAVNLADEQVHSRRSNLLDERIDPRPSGDVLRKVQMGQADIFGSAEADLFKPDRIAAAGRQNRVKTVPLHPFSECRPGSRSVLII